MYISGILYNLEQRLHQLASSSTDLEDFQDEAASYGDEASFFVKYKIRREFQKIYASLTGGLIWDGDIFEEGDDDQESFEFITDDTGNLILDDGEILVGNATL